LKECSLPLTGKSVVNSVITNLGMFEINKGGIRILEIAEGSTIDDIKKSTEAHIIN
jgi:3-oxoacid CoA-transferase subunit B